MAPAIDPEVWRGLAALEAAGEPGFLAELVRDFLSASPERLRAMAVAAARGEAALLERSAHGFKSSCAAIGALTMARHCEDLETLARGGSLAGHADILARLEAEWPAVRAALEEATGVGR